MEFTVGDYVSMLDDFRCIGLVMNVFTPEEWQQRYALMSTPKSGVLEIRWLDTTTSRLQYLKARPYWWDRQVVRVEENLKTLSKLEYIWNPTG